MDLNNDEKRLLETLKSLHLKLRDHTFRKYKRINPFFEDLFDWKERGNFWTGNNSTTIYNSSTVLGDVLVGENTWIGACCSLDGTAGITIGSYCSISVGVQILTHDSVKWCLSGGSADYDYAPVVIEDYCFIGTHSVILKGVEIGHHSVVGAGAVVTQNFPPYSIIAGVPAKRIGVVSITHDGVISFDYYSSSHLP